MAKGKRETVYHILIDEKGKGKPPFTIIEIPNAEKFKAWKRAKGLSLASELTHTGFLYGKLRNGQICYIVKGKVVVPVDGVTL